MKMYVLQVRSGYEISACQELRKQGFGAVLPTRQEFIRRGGTWQIYEKIIFTQYIFLRFELTEEKYYRIKKIDGIVRFLGFENGVLQPLSHAEQKYIEWLWNDGKPIEPSKIYVTPNGDKMIMSGILRKYSGDEIEYNLRQQKANIFIDIAGRKHKITLPVVRI
ncbi:MAG: hypothetical protein K2I80_02945 [Ruminococcus sp.]|nr:hypothetical protein [Ruminococcus sp.]MDE6847731.1 hypothetical protein [Ruminococcus sp.]